MNEPLLAFATGKSPAYLRAHAGEPLDPATEARYDALAARLRNGEPLAYIIGTAGFYRREFIVDPRVLVPRPETEHLVDAALAHLRGYDAPHILDVGTGSGAIACTLAAELPSAHVDAVDISPAALVVAAENRDRFRLEKRVTFYLGDLLAPVEHKRYDAIVANLPYVPTGAGEVSLRFEPALALEGGADGLDQYRRFFIEVPPVVKPGGLVLAEGAPPIAAGLLALARAAFPQAAVTMERDYGGRERYVVARCG
ncbi:MAG TPA: peptide chain release factor N(5)-glutamine methyltransferase [Candidatus Baltobacteraceae bacterium]|nr:peptide chain release factor N(5)-glutamine methyltransferase [Candidatus Baltobacteraceae bacterium]